MVVEYVVFGIWLWLINRMRSGISYGCCCAVCVFVYAAAAAMVKRRKSMHERIVIE